MAQRPADASERIQSEVRQQTAKDNLHKENLKIGKLHQSQQALRDQDRVCVGPVKNFPPMIPRQRAVSDPSPTKKRQAYDQSEDFDDGAFVGGMKGDEIYSGKHSTKRVRQGSNNQEMYEGEDMYDGEVQHGYNSMDPNDDYEVYNPDDYENPKNSKRGCLSFIRF